jgi:hypothetical protein
MSRRTALCSSMPATYSGLLSYVLQRRRHPSFYMQTGSKMSQHDLQASHHRHCQVSAPVRRRVSSSVQMAAQTMTFPQFHHYLLHQRWERHHNSFRPRPSYGHHRQQRMQIFICHIEKVCRRSCDLRKSGPKLFLFYPQTLQTLGSARLVPSHLKMDHTSEHQASALSSLVHQLESLRWRDWKAPDSPRYRRLCELTVLRLVSRRVPTPQLKYHCLSQRMSYFRRVLLHCNQENYRFRRHHLDYHWLRKVRPKVQEDGSHSWLRPS